ncbi:MAG: spore coat protein U domain-containing protein [Proteobacteria bacterium]|nr:spore coat protein U domain-containing protein [Pseudomonadota bacterium]MDA1132455.1 spore coat protein U domain-containing protein [Pseudomonadota bacterium]
MMRRGLAALVIAFAGLVATPAAAACSLTLRSLSNVTFASGEYSVFGPAGAAQAVQFTVRHRRSDPCDYFVTFSTGVAGSYDRTMTLAGTDLHYQIYDSASQTHVLKALPDAAGGEVIGGTFTTTGTEDQDVSYYILISPQQVVAGGNYEDQIEVRLYEGTLAAYVERDSDSIRIRAQISDEIEVCVGCTAAFDPAAQSVQMNFGDLDEGEAQSTVARVRSNAGYEFLVHSDNRGVMAHVSYPTQVPYVLEVDGAPIDLSPNQATAAAGAGVTGVDGVGFDFKVTIGSTAAAAAGDYADNIVLTVRKN